MIRTLVLFTEIPCYNFSFFPPGEHAFEIQVIPSSSSKDSPCKIVVLGVKSIFVLHHSGVLAYSKKLDFNPVTMLTYTSRKLIVLICFLKKLCIF